MNNVFKKTFLVDDPSVHCSFSEIKSSWTSIIAHRTLLFINFIIKYLAFFFLLLLNKS